MALATTEATILKTYEYSETSKILRLLTRDYGLCSVIAKGARRPKSRFGGLLEPFTNGIATFYIKEGRELHTLSGFELRRERQALGHELVRYGGAGLLTEVVFRCSSSAPDPALFTQLGRGLDRLLEGVGDTETVILEEMWNLVACLGFGPNVGSCSECGHVPGLEERVKFDVSGGAIICSRCHPKMKSTSMHALTAGEFAELTAIVSNKSSGGRKLSTTRRQRHLLRDFVAYHMAEHRPLNSFRFLEERLG